MPFINDKSLFHQIVEFFGLFPIHLFGEAIYSAVFARLRLSLFHENALYVIDFEQKLIWDIITIP